MRRLAVVLFFSAQLLGQSTGKATIKPFFDRIDDGPAFMLECKNTTAGSVSSGSSIWPFIGDNTVQVDGKLIDFGLRMGPGLMRPIAPGEMWTGILALRQSPNNFFPAVNFGANVRTGIQYPLSSGRHTITVLCNGQWSDNFVFFWESSKNEPSTSESTSQLPKHLKTP